MVNKLYSMKRLWLISKYALTPETGNQEQRLYNMATMLKSETDVTLITSNSNHLGRELPTGFKIFKGTFSSKDGFKIIYINAPRYPHSTSWKRILSWFIFEFNLFLYIAFFSGKDRKS